MVDSKAMDRLRSRLEASLSRLPFREVVILALDNTDCHVVGGALRDLFFGAEPRDIDLTVKRGGRLLSERLARALGARSVPLGGERFASFRVVAGDQTIDIWDRQGGALEDDLARRDFTLNSFAIDIAGGAVVDPFDGLRDLHDRNLVATSSTSFSSDPLRVLRLCRLVTQIEGARIPATTLELARSSVSDLDHVASERIGFELDRLLESTDAWPGVETMIILGIYPRILKLSSTRGHRKPRVPTADLRRDFRLADKVGNDLPAPIDWYLLRLALLILGSTSSGQLRSSLSRRARIGTFPLAKRRRRQLYTLLEQMGLPKTEREQRWFIHQLGHLWATTVCLLVVRQAKVRSSQATSRAALQIARLAVELGDELIEPRFLVSGDELQQISGFEPGPRLGLILQEVQKRQIEGEVATRSEAIALARHLVKQARGPT